MFCKWPTAGEPSGTVPYEDQEKGRRQAKGRRLTKVHKNQSAEEKVEGPEKGEKVNHLPLDKESTPILRLDTNTS